jgi:hypothetical protein
MLPVILVEGFGRCGSSMVMQMLDAGGIAIIGKAPGYEDRRVLSPVFSTRAAFYGTCTGKAVKCLDPHHFPPPPELNAVVIWLDRNTGEQAKSTIKFMNFLMPGCVIDCRSSRRKLAASYSQDRAPAQKSGLARTSPLKEIRFEEIITDPIGAAIEIADFLEPSFGSLDYEKMASVVIPRTTNCHHDLLEIALIRAQGGGR